MSRPEQVLLVVGGLLVAVGVGWRIITTRRIRRRLISLLGSADPATRAGTLAIVVTEGIDRFASTLRRMSETETDPAVLAALAAAVNRAQAMPARNPELISLRLWAAVRTAGPAVSADSAAPSRAGPAEQSTAPTLKLWPVLKENKETKGAIIDHGILVNGHAGRYRSATSGSSGEAEANGMTAPSGWSAPGEAPARARQITENPSWPPQPAAGRHQPAPKRDVEDHEQTSRVVLVTGAGGPAGVAVIRALRRAGHRVVAADADSSAVGLRLADEFARIPRADDPVFAESLMKAAARSGAEALIPTVAEELRPLQAASDQLRDSGLATWLPDPWSVEHAVDKWLFFELMTEHGVPVPATARWSERGVPGPWIVKPRFGRGSRDVYDAANTAGLSYATSRTPEPLVQTKITGREFTVDTLSGDDGQLHGAVPRWRVETKAGISTKGLTFDHPELVGKVAEVLAALRLTGPACVQGFLTEADKVVFIEVNPRFSGGLPLSLAAGADLVGQYLNRVLGGAVQPERLRFRPGVTMMRYFDEVFEE